MPPFPGSSINSRGFSNFPSGNFPFFQRVALAGVANRAAAVNAYALRTSQALVRAGGFYPNAYGLYVDPVQAYLQGSAAVIASQGNYLVSRQQQDLFREQSLQARLDNRRRVLDEYLERSDKVPTAEDDRERAQQRDLRRSRNDPPVNEICSGKALNDLLAHAQKLQARGVQGPDVPLEPETLKRLNVTTGKDDNNVGLLKSQGRLPWPLALRGGELTSEREQLDALLPDAIRQVVDGELDAQTFRAMTAVTERLRQQLVQNVKTLPPSQYADAKRFLAELDSALAVLRQPNAANYFTGKYAANGKTVRELVRYMTKQGLKFAPAVTGEEAAYVAVHRALVAYQADSQPFPPRLAATP